MSKRCEGTKVGSTVLLGCDCPLWGENIPKLNGFIVMGHIHGMQYDGEDFLYCGWCGKKREQSNDQADRPAKAGEGGKS